MKLEESWLILNLIGFRKLNQSWFYGHGSRRHQDNRQVEENIERLFSDRHVYLPREDMEPEHEQWVLSLVDYHEPKKPYRDPRIKINGPKKCARCWSTERLEREHIVPLYKGGKDETANLQWLCEKCHNLKHAKEKVEEALAGYKPGTWRHDMWQYRLATLIRLNPVEVKEFHSYGEDKKTLWSYWSTIRDKRLRAATRARTSKFFEMVDLEMRQLRKEEQQVREEKGQEKLLQFMVIK